MKILVCAATRTELNAAKAGVTDVMGKKRASERKLDFDFLLSGIGPMRAASNLKAHLARREEPANPFDLVVCTGFAGSTVDGSKVGEFFLAETIFLDNQQIGFIKASATQLEAFEDAKRGAFYTTAKLMNLVDIEGKIVDMESGALAQVATVSKTPFVSFRCVSDTSTDQLPNFLGYWTDALQEPSVIAGAKAVKQTVSFMAKNPVLFTQFLKSGMDLRAALRVRWKIVTERLVAMSSADR